MLHLIWCRLVQIMFQRAFLTYVRPLMPITKLQTRGLYKATPNHKCKKYQIIGGALRDWGLHSVRIPDATRNAQDFIWNDLPSIWRPMRRPMMRVPKKPSAHVPPNMLWIDLAPMLYLARWFRSYSATAPLLLKLNFSFELPFHWGRPPAWRNGTCVCYPKPW